MEALERTTGKMVGSVSTADNLGSLSDFVQFVNETVGKHFKCCICLSLFNDPVMLPCNHALCRECATQALKQNQRCPQCMVTIPNLRMLQGRNAWITEMVGSLRNCLIEVGASLTQHAPVPPMYQNARPPKPRAHARRRASSSGSGSGDRFAPPSPSFSVSCGGGGGGGSREVQRENKGTSSNTVSRRRQSPARSSSATAPPVTPPQAVLPPSAGAHGGDGQVAERAGVMSHWERRTPSPRQQARGGASVWGYQASQPEEEEGEGIIETPVFADATVRGRSASPVVPQAPPRPFVVGDLVFVDHRTWPGMNKHGGVALVAAVLDPPGSGYDVRYSVTQTLDRGVEALYVHPYSFPSDSVGIRSRRSCSRGGNSTGGGSGGDRVVPRSGTVSSAKRKRSARTSASSTGGAAASAAVASAVSGPAPGSFAPQGAVSVRDCSHEMMTSTQEEREEQTSDHAGRVAQAETVMSRVSDNRCLENGEQEQDIPRRKGNISIACVNSNAATLSGGSGGGGNGEPDSEETITDYGLGSDGEAFDEGEECYVEAGPRVDATGGQRHDERREDEEGGEADNQGLEEGRPPPAAGVRQKMLARGTGTGASGSVGAEAPPEDGVGVRAPIGLGALEPFSCDTPACAVATKNGRRPQLDPLFLASSTGCNENCAATEDLDSIPATSRMSPGVPRLMTPGTGNVLPATPPKTALTTTAVSPSSHPTQNNGYPYPGIDGASSTINMATNRSPARVCNAPSESRQEEKVDHRVFNLSADSAASSEFLPGQQPTPHLPPTSHMSKQPRMRSMIPPSEPTPKKAISSSSRSFSARATVVLSPSTHLTLPSDTTPGLPTFKVGDLVDVLPQTSPGFNKEGGVARVTRVDPNGPRFDVKYLVRKGADKGVAAALLSRYDVGDDGGADVAAGPTADSGASDSNTWRDKSTATKAGTVVGGNGSSVKRRVHRTSKGIAPPDVMTGLANARCLNDMLGDTQHPELLLDYDLGEDLDPTEGSSARREGKANAAHSATARRAVAVTARRENQGAPAAMGPQRARRSRGKSPCKGGKKDRDGAELLKEVTVRRGEGEGGGSDQEETSTRNRGRGRKRKSRTENSGSSEEDRGRGGEQDSEKRLHVSESDAASGGWVGINPGGTVTVSAPAGAAATGVQNPKDALTTARHQPKPTSDTYASGGRSSKSSRGAGGQGGRRGRARGVVLTMSGLTSDMTGLAHKLAKSRGWTVEAKYTDGITHVVCGTEKGTRTVNIRSVKYLRAVAAGKWVVTDAWLQECQLRDIQTAEEGFEISGDKKSTVPSGPRRSRILHADPDRPALFQNFVFHFRGEFGTESPPRRELEPMLLANGGAVRETLASLLNANSESTVGCSSSTRRIILFQASASSPERDAEALAGDLVALADPSLKERVSSGAGAEGGGVEVMRPLWLVDSIGSFRAVPPSDLHKVVLPEVVLRGL